MGAFSLGMGQRLGVASALLGDPQTLILDEPANGLDPEGILWIRNLLRGLAAEGRTVFLSSHLMAEIAQTAERLVVIGRGRLIADTSVAEVVAQASQEAAVHVRSPQAQELSRALAGPGVEVARAGADVLEVRGLSSERIGALAADRGLVLHELHAAAGLARGRLHAADPRCGRVRHDRARSRGARGGMSAVAEAPSGRVASRGVRAGRVTARRVLRSEWTKLWSLRSTRWSLLAAFVAQAGLGMVVAAFQMGHWAHMRAGERARYDSINTGVGGFHLAQLAIAVLGVLVISGEYSTGMIRSSFMAVPRRLPVLWAKAAVFGAVTFVLTLAASFISFFGVQAIVAQRHLQHGLSDAHALRVVFGAALFLTVLGILCVGLGALVRNTAGAIASFVGLLFVLPGVVAILPSSISDAVAPYLPINAGFAVATSTFDNSHHLAPWAGFGLFAGYAAAAVLAAAVLIARRDA